METTIKQAEEERNRCIESVKHLYEDYRPLKEDVDGLRNKIGLDTLPELQEEEDKLTPKYIYNLYINKQYSAKKFQNWGQCPTNFEKVGTFPKIVGHNTW